MMHDFRQFYTNFAKLSMEFLVFKENFPMRMEALSFINLIIKKNGINWNNYIYDEMVKNMKKHHLLQAELMVIKNSIKGLKVHSVFLFFSIIILNRENELIDLMVSIIFKVRLMKIVLIILTMLFRKMLNLENYSLMLRSILITK
jgi:hypothetical protein